MEPQCKLRLIDDSENHRFGVALFLGGVVWFFLLLFCVSHGLLLWVGILLFVAGIFGLASIYQALTEKKVLVTVQADALLLVYRKTGGKRLIPFAGVVSHEFKGERVSSGKGNSHYVESLRIKLENETLLLVPNQTPDMAFRQLVQDLGDARFLYAHPGELTWPLPPLLAFPKPSFFASRASTILLIIFVVLYWVVVLAVGNGAHPLLLVLATLGLGSYGRTWYRHRAVRGAQPITRRFMADKTASKQAPLSSQGYVQLPAGRDVTVNNIRSIHQEKNPE
jgi:hypothetical protein